MQLSLPKPQLLENGFQAIGLAYGSQLAELSWFAEGSKAMQNPSDRKDKGVF